MALEEFDITKDNIAKDTFLSLLANVSEQYNILLKKETITIDETTKILSQIMEAYSFYNAIKQSELTQELSDARIQLSQIATTFQNLEQFKGEKGDKILFSDFTSEEIEALRGAKGDSFLYEDFTPEQLEQLKGENGNDFTFDMFTPEQLEALRGAKGDSFLYEDFTPEQLLLLKGAKGDKGDKFLYSDFTPEQIALLKGAKGDMGIAGTTDYNNLQNKPMLIDKANKLNTARKILGATFDGSADVVSLLGFNYDAPTGRTVNQDKHNISYNTIIQGGFYNMADDCTEAPNGGWKYLQVFSHANVAIGAVYCIQICYSMFAGSKIYFRNGYPLSGQYACTWSAWQELTYQSI